MRPIRRSSLAPSACASAVSGALTSEKPFGSLLIANPVSITPLERARPRVSYSFLHNTGRQSRAQCCARELWSTWSTWSAVINLTSRAGELRSAPSGPDDRDWVMG